MAFSLSPAVTVREFDLTTIVPNVATSEGGVAGVFRWGPVEQAVLVDSEDALVARFGKPSNFNPETWFTASSYLAYSNKLYISRAANTTGSSPTVSASVESGNAVVTVANTSSLAVGMYVAAANSTGVALGAAIASITNSTAFNLSSGSFVTSNGTVEIQFLSNTAFSAVANTGAVSNLEYQIVKNEEHFTSKEGTFDSDVVAVARFPGSLGNSLRLSICAAPNAYSQSVNLASYGNATVVFSINSNTATVAITNVASNTAAGANATSLKALFSVTDNLEVGDTDGKQYLKITAIGNTTVTGNATTGTAEFTLSFEDPLTLSKNFTYDGSNTSSRVINRYWEFFNFVDSAPGQSAFNLASGNTSVNSDEIHLVVVDEDGKFTGVPGTVLETYKSLSRATDARSLDAENSYFKDVINDKSEYIYIVNDISGAGSNTAVNLTSATAGVTNLNFGLGNDGADENDIPHAIITRAYDLFGNAEELDISLIMGGKSRDFYLANYIIDNITEKRKDCFAFFSPTKSSVVNNKGNEESSIRSFRNNLRSSSYGALDSGYKKMYDRYNDLYRWIPLNGDIAGLHARTDFTNDAWWAAGGHNRGQIKNVVQLAYNPRKADRDNLYKNGINPVVTFPGEGTMLYGNKTLLSKPSAFDRINVRRLFIVIEKAIATAAKYIIFEFNDDFTRTLFKNMITPYLREVKGRRGITDFFVKCDSENNTPAVIDANGFVADIYIKANRTAEFINLNFINTPTGISFSEIQNIRF